MYPKKGDQCHEKTRAEEGDEDGDVIEILFDDALPDSLHHMIALEHRPQGGENGHQRHGLLNCMSPHPTVVPIQLAVSFALMFQPT